jgi:signal transduction histidine kinase
MAERNSGAFPFTTLVGIHTPSFRRLRMAHDQGLGGLARRQRATVRTLDYAGDWRLEGAPVKETQDEGIVSAMCTPLIIDGSIQGSLYLGDRHARAFSDTDADVLDEFANHASLRLSRQHVEEHRISVLRHRERERLASMLHDSVVRSLVEIGYHVQEARLTTEDAAVRGLLGEIGAAAGATLETLRSELASLGGPCERTGAPSAGELVEALRLVPRRPGVERSFELRGLDHDSDVPERLLDALIAVGEEALTNAERHSGCASETVVLEQTGAQLRLAVLDDGRGLDAAAAASAIADGSGHLGLRSMRTTTRALGGYVRVASGRAGRGTEVIAVVPYVCDGQMR